MIETVVSFVSCVSSIHVVDVIGEKKLATL